MYQNLAFDFKCIPKPILLKLQRKLADILEAPVMHVLCAIDKINYINKEFYPAFNAQRLYQILTCKNPLRLLNPNLPPAMSNNNESSGSEDEYDTQNSFWDRAKSQDKHYQWKKERQRQMQERRKAQIHAKKHKTSSKAEIQMNKNIILPKRMEAERRRLVLEFFIPHFIAMARSSERFESIKQAVIYLEQAHRLCVLLLEEPSGDSTANEYLDVIQDKLADYKRILVNQGGFKLPGRRDSQVNRTQLQIRKQRPKYQNMISQGSPTDIGIPAFSFIDVHMEPSTSNTRLRSASESSVHEESKL